MNKAFLIPLASLALLALLPVVNLLSTESSRADVFAIKSDNPYAKSAAHVFNNKCSNCHTSQTNYPFYYQLPGAQQLIKADIDQALAEYPITANLFDKVQRVPENYLSKLEHIVAQNTMPPMRYQVMHWGSGLTSKDKQVLLNWISYERKQSAKNVALWNEPIHPLSKPENVDSNKVALGFQLFHDKRLSGDNTLACASCHALNLGGTDRSKVSVGIRGQKGGINSPTVFNATHNFVQFWDGRAENLQEQAAGPVANPIEMGAQWPEVIQKLQLVPEYQAAFKALYPDGITQKNVTDAIANFEATLVTPNSRFDQYLLGNADALTAKEKKGYALFKSVGCTTCHMGTNLGGMEYEKFGKFQNYFGDRGKLTDADNGRFNVTKAVLDRNKFKVPTLRNIAQTAPYFHDGSTRDLKEAVRVMAKYQLGKKLSAQQQDEIAAFLQSLTGEYQGKAVQ